MISIRMSVSEAILKVLVVIVLFPVICLKPPALLENGKR